MKERNIHIKDQSLIKLFWRGHLTDDLWNPLWIDFYFPFNSFMLKKQRKQNKFIKMKKIE